MRASITLAAPFTPQRDQSYQRRGFGSHSGILTDCSRGMKSVKS